MLVASLVVGSSGLAISVTVLALTVLNFQRDRERADVDWQVEPELDVGRGAFTVMNTGRDIAFKANVEMWDGHDYVTEEAAKVGRGNVIRVLLPHRQEHGPDDVKLPPQILPMDSSDPIGQAVRASSEAMNRKIKADREGEQVSVRIVWRTKRGTWHTHLDQTG